jgi:glyoxylase-like metal-dependent hydrolase (beta-lactamase superfamily II)
LIDYETFEWGPYRLFLQPTPGHTLGHTALVGEVDGQKVAFSGDLMAEPGKMHTLYDLQYDYASYDGCDFMVYSLRKMQAHNLDLACPSHGDPFRDVNPAFQELENTIRAYMLHHWGVSALAVDVVPVEVLPHLIQIPGCSNTWVVLSDTGKALFVDYGSQHGILFTSNHVLTEAGNRLRMLEHNLDVLRDEYGVKKIDVAIPSHYHDDHVNGLPFLQKHLGTEIWCYKNMKDILENPQGYKLGCVFSEPVTVSRAFDQGESFRWEEYEFQVFHAPGHSDYHMGMFGSIDGTSVGFSGDEIGFLGDKVCSNNIWRNHVHAHSHEITGKLFLEKQPEMTCPGHGNALHLSAEQWQSFYDWCIEEQRFWGKLAAPENVEQAIFPDYVFLYPYQPSCPPGGTVPMQVWYENIFEKTSTLEFSLNLPASWRADPDSGALTVEPGEKGTFEFQLTLPEDPPTFHRRQPFTVDATIDGKRYGQVAEAVVDMRPRSASGGNFVA